MVDSLVVIGEGMDFAMPRILFGLDHLTSSLGLSCHKYTLTGFENQSIMRRT